MHNEPTLANAPLPWRGLRTPRRAVSAMFMLNGAFFGMWASRVPAIAQIHQLSESLLGLLLLSMCAGAILSFPTTGHLVERHGSAAVTKAVALLYGVTLTGLAFAPNSLLLAAALFAFGAAHGAMDVAMNAWAGEVEKARGKPIMSSFHAMWSFGSGMGAATGFLAVQMALSPTLHFLIGGALGLLLALPFGFISWASPRREKRAGEKQPLFVLPKGALALVGLMGLCAGLGEGAMGDWGAIFLVHVAQANEGTAALGYSCFSVTMVIMRLAGDYIIGKLGAVRAARMSGFLAASGSLLAISVATMPAIFIGFAMMGLGYAFVVPLAFSRASNDDTMSPGPAIAAVATFGYGGGLIGPVAIGLLADALSIRWAFLLLSSLALLIILLAPNLTPPKREAGR
ncbi:MFS transporter [uncultured Cohaesibacter sp.]|uniref:MFS transporter n=1 Tax=uncultured Cohaesibacter sp. TaxID=1002546 RepID=UPI0029C6B955|nr:MFS transporter [uncultured Cohaesibacter sp.]